MRWGLRAPDLPFLAAGVGRATVVTPPPEAPRPFRFTLDREAGDQLVVRADTGMSVWRERIRPGRITEPEAHADQLQGHSVTTSVAST